MLRATRWLRDSALSLDARHGRVHRPELKVTTSRDAKQARAQSLQLNVEPPLAAPMYLRAARETPPPTDDAEGRCAERHAFASGTVERLR